MKSRKIQSVSVSSVVDIRDSPVVVRNIQRERIESRDSSSTSLDSDNLSILNNNNNINNENTNQIQSVADLLKKSSQNSQENQFAYVSSVRKKRDREALAGEGFSVFFFIILRFF